MAANQTDGDSHLNMPKLGFQMVKSGVLSLKRCDMPYTGFWCVRVPGLEEAPGPEGRVFIDSAPLGAGLGEKGSSRIVWAPL